MIARFSRLAGRVTGRRDSEAGVSSPPDLALTALSDEDRRIVEAALPYTMTGVARLVALVDAVRYCVAAGVAGDFVECGVWRGGSVIAMVQTLLSLGVEDRDIHLYDTFEGMTRPTEHDTSRYAPPALEDWDIASRASERPWSEMFGDSVFNEEQVRRSLVATGYPAGRFHIVRGPVETTLEEALPNPIALLRLDTDWYESTRVELEKLYPLLVSGGVLLIDDYGHWDGCRRAVDEFFAARRPLLLNRIDYTGRVAVKP